MEETINHEEAKIEILKVLYNNRDKLLNAHQIRRYLGDGCRLRFSKVEAYLFELLNEEMIKKHAGKTIKIPGFGLKQKPTTSKGEDTFHIADRGIKYFENDFKKKPESGLDKIAGEVSNMNDSLSLLINEVKLTGEEQIKQNELLEELREVLYDESHKDDSKARKILKTALDAGKNIAIPLIVEYLKSEAIQHGIIL